MEKLEDVKTFIRGVYCYGWIGFAPCRKMVREIFHRVFQAIGTLGYAGTALKRALLFVHIDVVEVNLEECCLGYASCWPHAWWAG